MSSDTTHHIVTIRLEEHVEQLEKAYRAFVAVRTQLDDAEHAFLEMDAGHAAGMKLEAALGGLRKAAGMVNAALHEFELPCAGGAAERA